MTALDIMVALSLGIAGFYGFTRGFTREIFSLAAWVAGVAAVKLFYAPTSALLAAPVGNIGGAAVLAVALCFGVAFVFTRLIGQRLGQAAKASLLGPVDRVLGLGFGLFKGLLAATLAFLIVTLIYDFLNGPKSSRPGWMTDSRSYTLLRASAASLSNAIEAGRTS